MLILASASPQRRAILAQLGIAFEARPVDVEEISSGEPRHVARTNAVAKARAGATLAPGETVLGVDTIVARRGEIFGKPHDANAAHATLAALAGGTHAVVSGIALVREGEIQDEVAVTLVTFRAASTGMLDRYVATGEWRGRAGGYAIQGAGAALVTRIEGDYLNVVGLPVAAMLDRWPELLGESGPPEAHDD